MPKLTYLNVPLWPDTEGNNPPAIEVDPDDYFGYFRNESGEVSLFLVHRGSATGTLWHQDNGWQPLEVNAVDLKSGSRTSYMRVGGEFGTYEYAPGQLGTGYHGGISLEEDETAWLRACWKASSSRRRKS